MAPRSSSMSPSFFDPDGRSTDTSAAGMCLGRSLGLSSTLVGSRSIREGKEETREGIDPAQPVSAAEVDDEAGAGRGGLLRTSEARSCRRRHATSRWERCQARLAAGGQRPRWVASSGCRA